MTEAAPTHPPAWPSTKGLSVYNALSCAMRDMTETEILAYLRAVWDPTMQSDYVREGIEFLTSLGMVNVTGDVVGLKERGPNGKGRLVVRANNDRTLQMLPHWSP